MDYLKNLVKINFASLKDAYGDLSAAVVWAGLLREQNLRASSPYHRDMLLWLFLSDLKFTRSGHNKAFRCRISIICSTVKPVTVDIISNENPAV